MSLRVLCIGSPFGADRLGLEVGRRLASLLAPSEAEVELLDRPGATLIPRLQGASRVVIVDALRGSDPGVPRWLTGEQASRALSRHTSTHGFGLAEALALAARLGDLPEVCVLGLCCAGDEPSQAEIERLCATLIERLRA
jgi:hydrogenase maturation protease